MSNGLWRPVLGCQVGVASLLAPRISRTTNAMTPPITRIGHSIIGRNITHRVELSCVALHHCIQSHHDHMARLPYASNIAYHGANLSAPKFKTETLLPPHCRAIAAFQLSMS